MKATHRQATHDDHAWLYGLKVASMRDYVEAIYGWDETIQRDFFDKCFRPEEIKIITIEGRVGMFELECDDDGYFLKRIEIHPTFQGRGIGSQIIEEILERASGEEREVRLMVFKINPAKELYERLGFSITQETETHFKMVRPAPICSRKSRE